MVLCTGGAVEQLDSGMFVSEFKFQLYVRYFSIFQSSFSMTKELSDETSKATYNIPL